MKVYLFSNATNSARGMGAFKSLKAAKDWGAQYGFTVVREHQLQHSPVIFTDSVETMRLQHRVLLDSNKAFLAELDDHEKAEQERLKEYAAKEERRLKAISEAIKKFGS